MSLSRFFNKFVFISVSFIPTMDICPFCCESNKNSVIENILPLSDMHDSFDRHTFNMSFSRIERKIKTNKKNQK